MPDVACVLDAKSLLGEGPLWDVAARRLYWVDIKRRQVHRFDPQSGRDEAWPTLEDIGSLAVREKRDARGELVVALKSGFHFLDLASGKATPIVNPEGDRPGNRFNDGKPDPRGRFWAGSMDDGERAPSGGLYRLDRDLSCQRLVEGIICSNALCWSPDARTLYYADSNQHTVWAWDFAPESGAIGNRRIFIEIPPADGVPDGATVDAEGCLWLAQWGGWRVTRYDPDGRAMQVVSMPVKQPTCPAFGGPGLDVLYVTSASIGLSAGDLQKQPHAGGIFAFEPGVKGIAEQRFAG